MLLVLLKQTKTILSISNALVLHTRKHTHNSIYTKYEKLVFRFKTKLFLFNL